MTSGTLRRVYDITNRTETETSPRGETNLTGIGEVDLLRRIILRKTPIGEGSSEGTRNGYGD